MTPREPVRKIDKEYIFKMDKNTCVYCGAPAEVIDFDTEHPYTKSELVKAIRSLP